MKIFKKTIYYSIILFTFLSIFTSCSLKTGKTEPIYENWKIKFGDNQTYAAPDFNDSSWENINTNSLISVQNGNHYFWLRKTIKIPDSLKNSNVWIGFQKTNSAIQVYANGVYVGSRGNFPPNLSVKIEQNTDVLIPTNCINNGTVVIALRVYAPGSNAKDICPSLDDDTQGYFMNNVKNIFIQ